MTDNDIKKGLECISGKDIYCRNCSYSKQFPMTKCRKQCAKDALNLINRQKAEIERLNKILNTDFCFIGYRGSGKTEMQRQIIKVRVDEIKANAVKEFAERFKEKIRDIAKIEFQSGYYYLIGEPFIDNLVEEMEEECNDAG